MVLGCTVFPVVCAVLASVNRLKNKGRRGQSGWAGEYRILGLNWYRPVQHAGTQYEAGVAGREEATPGNTPEYTPGNKM